MAGALAPAIALGETALVLFDRFLPGRLGRRGASW
jgi:hypothetical protein